MMTFMSADAIIPQRHSFVKALARALRHRCGVAGRSRLLAAVSGGADSVALLRALAGIAPRRGWNLTLAVGHVQHHLRPEEQAEGDAAFVADLAKQLGLPYLRADLDLSSEREGNVEARARRERYRALAEMAVACDADYIVTAHHGDDQLETMLMRLLRGSSVTGLTGIAWRKRVSPSDQSLSRKRLGAEEFSGELPGELPGALPRELPGAGELPGGVIRPMLRLDHAAACEFLRAIGQPWREDHTNADISRLRARLRREVTPRLRAIRLDAPQKAASLADHLRQVAILLHQAIDTAADRVIVEDAAMVIDRVEARLMPRVVLTGLLRRLLREAGVHQDRLGARHLAPLLRAIHDTQGGRRRFAFSDGARVIVTRGEVTLKMPNRV